MYDKLNNKFPFGLHCNLTLVGIIWPIQKVQLIGWLTVRWPKAPVAVIYCLMERLISDEMLAKAAGIDKWPVPGLDRLLMLLMKLDQFNAGFRQVRHLEGMAFVDGVLEILNIHVDLSDNDVKRIPLCYSQLHQVRW